MTYTRWLIEPLSAGEGGQRERERALAYDMLCRLLDGEHPRLEHDEKGAPYLPEHPEISVSISHCRKAVAVVVSSEGRVGIDVECRRKIGDGLLERVCTPDEQAAVCAAEDSTMAFLQLWTRKEAVLKMRGTGIQGFGSMVDALTANDCHVIDLEPRVPDVVASLAMGE
ncbi:MAG: 4'-phosphopantetheinyl transferase superfamily protein [Bacteroidales bacterium]|nr:4'-phosphopantetheinyl transferase superfamily protein [Bacteroidales bacterium]MBQ6743027.1 4'-phosphopantetheinyl transferase superfamily protein [Bacteroidales bacterium]